MRDIRRIGELLIGGVEFTAPRNLSPNKLGQTNHNPAESPASRMTRKSHMPLMNGLEAGLRLKEMMPSAKIIFLTMNDDPDLAVNAMRSGASAYLLKRSAAAELIHARFASICISGWLAMGRKQWLDHS